MNANTPCAASTDDGPLTPEILRERAATARRIADEIARDATYADSSQARERDAEVAAFYLRTAEKLEAEAAALEAQIDEEEARHG